ncbi:MAG: SLBB domain-containing protein [Gemmatimonadales bacterium]
MLRRFLICWAAMAALLPNHPALLAQVPTQAEAMRMLQEDPERVRELLLGSGIPMEEMRSRLMAAGYSPEILDRFLEGGPLDSLALQDPNTLGALRSLGVAVQTPDGVQLVPVQSGLRTRVMTRDSVETLPIFGMDVFNRATSQFQPLLFAPPPDDYRMGPGDQLVIVLTGEVELTHEVEVTREGFIVIPNVGQISVANLSLGDLRAVLTTRFGRAYSGVARGTTNVSVSVARLRTNQIYVTGEVAQPGAYQLASVATVTNALYAAGGPTKLAGLRSIQIHRRSGVVDSLDLYPYLLRGDASGDVVLQQGDNVFVPLRGRRVEVHGAVVRPAHYEVAESEDLLDVLRAAGGFAPEALRDRLTIYRVLRPAERGPGLAERQAIDLELRPTADPSGSRHLGGVVIPPIGLQDGDSIVVDSVPSLEDGYYVTIAGSVRAPGRFAWHPGMTLRELVGLARGPTVSADLREAEVSRMPRRRQTGQLAERLRAPLDSSYLSLRSGDTPFRGPPGVPFPPPGASPELELEPFDEVLILQQPDFDMPVSVVITGEVSIPGRYTLLTKSDRVSDLVGRAGGILNTGYSEGARLIRRENDLGRIDVDLAAALADPTGDDNVILQANDSLHIPAYSPTVVVRGAVNSPVTVMYRPGEGLDYYIANAGGYRSDADKGRVSVRYANGSARTRSKFLFVSSYPEPGPGSEVLVPVEPPSTDRDWVTILGPALSAVGSIVALIIAVSR